MKKYYNIEIAYNTREMINRVDNFRTWLYDNNIKHETSAAGDFVHFEILLSEDEVARVPKMERYKIKVTKIMRNKIKSHIAKGYNNIAF